MNNFKIGIIVAVYNSYPYIKKCVESLINQTYQNIEICLVNDGSTDKDTLDFLNNVINIDDRIIVINKPNGGAGSARNVGIDYFNNIKANIIGGGCDYVMFVDSDDFLDIKCIEECVKYSHGMDIVWFHWSFVEHRSEYREKKAITPVQWIDRLKEKNINYFWFGLGGLIDFSFLISSNIRFIEGYMHEDHAFGIQLFSSAKNIFVLPISSLYNFVRSQNSVTRIATDGNVHIYPHIKYLTKYFNNNRDLRGYYSEISAIVINSTIIKYIYQFKDKKFKDKLLNTFTYYADNTLERCLRLKIDPLNFYKQAIIYNKIYSNKPVLFNDIDKDNLFLICRYIFFKKTNELISEIINYKNKLISLEQENKNQIDIDKFNTISLRNIKSENQKLQKINADLYFTQTYGTAKSRIKNQLSYKLGQAMIENSKSLLGY
uniref:glycosyltransferase family 2 protein n=1 Tax=Campylobacter lanienae TaxID=75658 RepID=UPI000BB4437A